MLWIEADAVEQRALFVKTSRVHGEAALWQRESVGPTHPKGVVTAAELGRMHWTADLAPDCADLSP
jgi:hypothetical protein